MLTTTSWRDPTLVNSAGHTAGLLAFALVIALLIRDSRVQSVRQTRLPLMAAVLALLWNAGSLTVLGAHDQDASWVSLVVTASLAVLSLLPAILLQVVLQGRSRRIVALGYVVSAVAVVLHFSELLFPREPLHQAALTVIAAGFGLLSVAAFVRQRQRRREHPGQEVEWLRLGCLLLFSLSFLHFGYQHVSSPWSAEITWHHLGIPAALVILLQDYRALLLDTFVRFLINFGLSAIYVGFALTSIQRFMLRGEARLDNFTAGIALVLLCLSLVLFAYLRNVLQALVSRSIFRRSNLEAALNSIATVADSVRSERELLARASEEVAQYLQTEQFVITSESLGRARATEKPSLLLADETSTGALPQHFRPEVQIPLRFSNGDNSFLVAGPRRGGRRYLSEDLEALHRLAGAVVVQVERFRAAELKRLVSQAELRALQAQINPHFLFNSLNTLYGTIDRKSVDARRMVLNLSELFRYLLRGDRAVIQLSEELRIIRAYLEIESLRLGDRLNIEWNISEAANSATIPVLSIQPLVENAIKHGIAEAGGRGTICVRAGLADGGVLISISDTGPGFQNAKRHRRGGAGVGLENVRRRLILCYGPDADLKIQSSPDGTTVSFLVPAHDSPDTVPGQVAASV